MAGEDIIRARKGDTLDGLLWRERGLTATALPAVLEANPGVAGMGSLLPVGTPVIVPAAAPSADTLTVINLWD